MGRRRDGDVLGQALHQTEQGREPQGHADTLTSLAMRCAVLLVAVACGPASRAPTHAEARLVRDAGAQPLVASAPTDAECSELVGHALALGIAEDREAPEDPTKLRAQLEADFGPGCKTLVREELRCGLAAPSLAALVACQRTPSSSTSNSSVAPPGIAPPAPRSP